MAIASPSDSPSVTAKTVSRRKGRLAFLLLLATCGVGYQLRDWLSWQQLYEHQQALAAWQESDPFAACLITLAVLTLATALSFPVSPMLAIVTGWLFGFEKGIVIVIAGSSAGCTLAFWTGRYLFRDAIQRRWPQFTGRLNTQVDELGPFLIFFLRAMPIVPYFMINYGLSVTSLRSRTFVWASVIGLLPCKIIYTLLGASIPAVESLAEHGVSAALRWEFLLMLALLAILPLALKMAAKHWFPNLTLPSRV